MKKNRMMRLASGLLVAVLITTSTISGTFAKYTTADTAEDTARVAKFGVTVEAAGELFNDSYKDGFTIYNELETGDGITVQAISESTKVVAPGTNNTLTPFTFTVEGKPEVDVEVVYTADVTLTGWEVTGDWDSDPLTADETVTYFPIVFKVNGTPFTVDSTITTTADLETAIETAITNLSKGRVDANHDLATNSDLEITWEWPFSTSALNDAKDTALGDAAAAALADADDTTNPAKVTLDVTCTVNQLD